jgi:hypothetical protein
LEAFVYKEVRAFMDGVKTNGGEQHAFKDFLALASELASDPDRAATGSGHGVRSHM